MLDKADINEYKQRVIADFNSRTNYDKGIDFPRTFRARIHFVSD